MAQGESPQHSDFSDIEKKLEDLRPTQADSGYLRKMGHRFDAMERDREEKKALWHRFIPVAVTAGIVLTSTLVFQAYLEDQAALLNARAEAPPAPSTEPGLPMNQPPPVGKIAGSFMPVSSGEFFRGATDGAIVGIEENGEPLREVHLEYEKQWQFHDPHSGTHLEFIWPEETIILVPVETD